MGTRVFDAGDMSLFTSVEFAPAHGHVTEQQLALYRKLIGHIGNAWRLGERISRDRTEGDLAQFINDQLPWGVVTLDTLEAGAEKMHERTLGRSWRAEQEEILSADQTNAEQVDDIVLADKGFFHRREHFAAQSSAEGEGIGHTGLVSSR